MNRLSSIGRNLVAFFRRQVAIVPPSGHWYARPTIAPRTVALIALLVFCSIYVFYRSRSGAMVLTHVNHRVSFWVRKTWEHRPQMDPRLKIFALDHRAMAELQSETLRAEDWIDLMRAINARRPEMVFIDKSFDFPPDKDASAQRVFRSLLRSGPPIVASIFFTEGEIEGRGPLSLERSDYDLGLLLEDGRLPPWLTSVDGIIYGPHPSFVSAFSHLGYTRLWPGGYVRPLLAAGDGRVLPHWSLFAGEPARIRKGSLFLKSGEVPLNEQGFILPDLAPSSFYARQVFSLRQTLRAIRQGGTIDRIQPGDYVVLLTNLHASEGNPINTPAGSMPNDYVLVSLVNSALTGRWLKPARAESLIFLASVIGGAALGATLAPVPFLLSMAGAVFGVLAFGIIAFVWGGYLFPWVFVLLALVGTGGLVFAEKSRVTRWKLRRLRGSLEPVVDPRKLTAMLVDPRVLQLDPSSQVLTVMYVDMVGFSESAESKTPAAVFTGLQEFLATITPIVHRYGGAVDRTATDGLLCFFGYNYGLGVREENHAEQAVQCALEIQRESLTMSLAAHDDNRPVFPLRIGVNTAELYVGDTGGEGRIEFAVVGLGVRHARRLQFACDQFLIMISHSTYDLIGPSLQSARVERRLVQKDKADEMLEGYEINPFHGSPELLKSAAEAFRKSQGIHRSETRWPVPANLIEVISERGRGRLHNFSSGGLGVMWDEYYGRGTQFTLTLKSANVDLEALCEKHGLRSIVVEVRWGRPHEGKYLHGLAFKNLTMDQASTLLTCLRSCLQTKPGRKSTKAA